MAPSDEQIDRVIACIKAEKFADASSIIVDKQGTSDIIRDEVEETLQKLSPPITGAIIQNIAEVYDKYSNSLPLLKKALDHVIKDGVVSLKSKASTRVELKDIQALTDDQLASTINRIRTEQNNIVSKGKAPNAELAKELNILLKEKGRRSNPKRGKKIVLESSSSKPTTEPSSEAAKSWFVLPDKKELENKDDVSVVVGSPAIEILRKRYIKKNK
jgi:hypothetical protein